MRTVDALQLGDAEVALVRTSGLGDTSYVLMVGDEAVIVDPQRDIERFLEICERAQVGPRFVLETHIHNDYVSGGRHLATTCGAELVLPASSGAAFPFTPAFHGEPLRGSTFSIRPVHTPGHTPEHTSYVVSVDGVEVAVFSGGSLLVGSAGRTDLLGDDRAEQLARLQFRSVQRLAGFDPDLALLPTHGEGSFCTSSGAGRHTSTIGEERVSNPVLGYPDEEAFVVGQIAGLGAYPDYYAHMAPINLAGPLTLPPAEVPQISLADVPDDARLVDVRPRERFAAGHVPGSLGIPTSDQTGVWSGWLLPFDTPVALVADADQDVAEYVRQFNRIGFDHVVGVVHDLGEQATASFDTATDAELAARIAAGEQPQILDVRAPSEWEQAHLEGSTLRYLPDLEKGPLDELDPAHDVWVICATGHRATIACGILERLHLTPVLVAEGGVASTLDRLAAQRP